MTLSERQKLEQYLKTLIYHLNLEEIENYKPLRINESELERMFDFIRLSIKKYSKECDIMQIKLVDDYVSSYLLKYNNKTYIIGNAHSYKNGLSKVLLMNNEGIMITKGNHQDWWYGYEIEKNENKIPDFNDIIKYFKQESINTSIFSLDYSLRQLREDGLTEEQIKTIVDNLLSKYVQETEFIKEDIEIEEENSKTPKK